MDGLGILVSSERQRMRVRRRLPSTGSDDQFVVVHGLAISKHDRVSVRVDRFQPVAAQVEIELSGQIRDRDTVGGTQRKWLADRQRDRPRSASAPASARSTCRRRRPGGRQRPPGLSTVSAQPASTVKRLALCLPCGELQRVHNTRPELDGACQISADKLRVLSSTSAELGTRNRVFVEFGLVLWAARKLAVR